MRPGYFLSYLALLHLTPATAEEKRSRRDLCVLDLCFTEPGTLNQIMLQKRFGKAKNQKEIYSQTGNCYRLKDSKARSAYLYLFYESKGNAWILSRLQLSREAICDYPSDISGELINRAGISLFSSADDILNIHGNPQRKRSPDADKRKFYGKDWQNPENFSLKYISEDEIVSEVFISRGIVLGFDVSHESDP